MSSVNEVNAYQRGLAEGRRQGEAVMRTAGSTAKEAYKLGKFTHWAKILIAQAEQYQLDLDEPKQPEPQARVCIGYCPACPHCR